MFTTTADRKSFTTSDGATLSYLEAGSGPPFVMVPGWSQTALQWHNQIDRFSASHRVIAVDMRGHGQSEKVEHGYRISRLATDIRELVLALDLADAVMMGHSMGCSVLWSYFDLYGSDRVAKFVFVDQSPFLASTPLLSEAEHSDAGAIFTDVAAQGAIQGLRGPDGAQVTADFVGGMFTPDCPREIVEGSIRLNMDFPRRQAATLVYDHVYNDWRDVFARIDVPCLCVGGKISLVPFTSVEWMGRTIPDARTAIFEPDEGGAHFMFMENPDRFNGLVADFIA